MAAGYTLKHELTTVGSDPIKMCMEQPNQEIGTK